jgi:hypothetical protein
LDTYSGLRKVGEVLGRIRLNDASIRSRVLQESWRIQFYYTINVMLARRGRNMGGLVVNQPVGRGFKHQLRVLLPMTIAPGRLAVSFPTLLQQLDFGFWCDAEPPKSENCGAD